MQWQPRYYLPQNLYLGVVQFLFTLTWVIYVIYLGQLLEKLGWPKSSITALLLFDQCLFIAADIIMGFFADHILRKFGRIAPWVLIFNLIACLAFVSLPTLAGVGSTVFLITLTVWVFTASVLRAPLFGLMSKYKSLEGTSALLVGLGLASALAPHLGAALKGIDPELPFVLSGASLALAVWAFSHYEVPLTRQASDTNTARSQPNFTPIALLLFAMLLVGGGFQLHAFINAKPLFEAVVNTELLRWLMPVFWIGFSLTSHAGKYLLQRFEASRLLLVCSALGTVSSAACTLDLTLWSLVAAHAVAGMACGGVLGAAMKLVGKAGSSGREVIFTGSLLAILSAATAIRVGLGFKELIPPLHTSLLMASLLLAAGTLLIGWWSLQQDNKVET